jgi:hypothetical protein
MAHDLITDLGGTKAVADALGVNSNVVANWRARGIPWRRRHAIARLAAQLGKPLPQSFWETAA